MKAVHMNILEHKCTKCSYSTNYSGHLKTHVKARLRDHICTLCTFALSQAAQRKIHVKSMHLKVPGQ